MSRGSGSLASISGAAPRSGRTRPGRPRDEQIDSEVVAAVLGVLRTSGYRSVTIEKIARDVGRARTSLYRRWPSKRHLVAYAVISELGDNPAPDTGDLRRDLVSAVKTLWAAFRGPLGQALGGLVGEMAQDPELAALIREDVLAARRRSMRAAFARALDRGEVRDDLDIELVLDMLTGPFYYRALFKHAAITRRTTSEVVDCVLRVVAAATELREDRRKIARPRRET
ncbi:MAG TPA: TetR/AcrR family transcriptional regulator [Steroidobacteraceae bacterium]|nr:TetR/AcrR family transcriptional regulator [Steroidobacteraceae bacterium]